MMDANQIAAATLPLPATERIGSDSCACQVVAASPSGKTITVRRPHRPDRVFTWRAKRGVFMAKGAKVVRGCFLEVGVAVDRYDPHF